MAAFRAELQKAHRRHDLLLCLLLPGIVVLWVGGLSPSSPEELANGYSALLYSIPVIEAILLPVMMAVLACRLWDMEVKGNTAKLLYTLQTRRSLFAGKAVFGTLEVLLTAVLERAGAGPGARLHRSLPERTVRVSVRLHRGRRFDALFRRAATHALVR